MARKVSAVRSAAVYARISADVEGKSLGVQRQLEDCRKLAAERGWVVGHEYVDNDISAYSGKARPGYEAMCSDLAAGVRDAVIVYNLDRLHRRPVELEEFVALCEAAGVNQVATVTADIDLGNDDGLFMARIFAAFAAKESGRKSARMKRKYEQKAAQGLPHGPNRPFGYDDDKITIRDAEAEVVRQLVVRVIAGESVNSLTAWLNETDVKPVRGGRGPPRRCAISCLHPGLPGCALIRVRWSAKRPGNRSSLSRSAIRCWPRCRCARGTVNGPRASICCRGCAGADAASPACFRLPAWRPERTSAGMCVPRVPITVGAGV